MTCVIAAPDPFDESPACQADAQSDALWDAVRDAYLAGATVARLRDDFGVPSSTFYKRAGREGWLHRPRVSPEIEPLDLEAPVADPRLMLDLAWRRLCRALDQDRPADALRWLRLHDALKALVGGAPAEARRDPPAAGPSAPIMEKVETVFPDSTPLGARAPLNRAERRRLARRAGGP